MLSYTFVLCHIYFGGSSMTTVIKKNAENDFLKLWLLKVHLRAIELWRVPNYFLSFSHKYIYQKSVTA